MYVCVCQGITERDIDGAVADGCSTLRQLRERLGVGEVCGRCAQCARRHLAGAQPACRAHTASATPAACLAAA